MRNPNINREKLPAGHYYIGDLSFILEGEEYDELIKKVFPSNDMSQRQSGVMTLSNGKKFAIFGTMFGYVFYYDQYDYEYGVDSGAIGAFPVEDLNEGHELGNTWSFEEPFECDYEQETGIMRFDDITIHTNLLEGDDTN